MVKTKHILLLLFISISGLLLPGAGIEPSSTEMAISKNSEIQKLMRFKGNWESKVTFTIKGIPIKVNYHVDCKETADGSGLYVVQGFTHPIYGSLKETDVIGFDTQDAKIKWFAVDNMGTAHLHTGNWKTPDHLHVEHTGNHSGKIYYETIDFRFKGKDEMSFNILCTLDGVTVEKGEGVFKRKN